ncbi:MAG TPA: hypothetical protein VHD32_14885 [Candidatus Didemnitutus sp.]|nr:hypothetical protein [Candidatus Didemnitutus sp.]
MKWSEAIIFAGAGLASLRAGDEWIDRLDDRLTLASGDGFYRAHLSGLAETDAYFFSQPAPGLLYADGNQLVAPQLTLFVDAQAGERWYAFLQARADDGFDPGDGGERVRLDEYAVRASLGDGGSLNVQVGKFATVFGNWVPRHYAWDNPFVTAPLPYENLTGIFDVVAAWSADSIFRWGDVRPSFGGSYAFHEYRVPVIWGPSYASGASVSGVVGRFEYAAEIKNASLSSRPETWDVSHTQWQNPTYTARIAIRPDEAWSLGISASEGTYLLSSAASSVRPGYSLGDYRETVIGQDISYAWHHFQFWAELMETRFAIPTVGDADTIAYYLEAKYKFSPEWSGAVRWNQQFFGDLSDGVGNSQKWGRDVWRIDVAPTLRLTPHLQLKVQYSLLHNGSDEHRLSNEFDLQALLRF